MIELITLVGGIGVVVAFAIFWVAVHMLAKPGTEISLLAVFKYTKRDRRKKTPPITPEPEIEVFTVNPPAPKPKNLTKDQTLLLQIYKRLDETRLGSNVAADEFRKIGGTTIRAEAALKELVGLGYLHEPGSFDEDGYSYPLTSKGMSYLSGA